QWEGNGNNANGNQTDPRLPRRDQNVRSQSQLLHRNGEELNPTHGSGGIGSGGFYERNRCDADLKRNQLARKLCLVRKTWLEETLGLRRPAQLRRRHFG